MKIAFFGHLDPDKKTFYTQKLSGHELDFYEQIVSEENIPEKTDYEVISVFVDCPVNKSVISAFPNLKFIAARSTGYDNIDLVAAKEKGIVVSNVPAYGSETVAEYAIGLIFALARSIPQAFDRVQNGLGFNFLNLRGIELKGKTLGVVGTGKIGVNVIRMAAGIGMKVLAYDVVKNEQAQKDYGFEYVEYDNLLQNSDFITYHVPALPQTEHMLNSENISKVKKGAFIINTSRGIVIETGALVEAIKNGSIAGAALDVIEKEDLLKKDISKIYEDKSLDNERFLVTSPKVILTPHMAFYTVEGEQAIMETTADNILKFIEGNPVNLVA